MLAKKSIVWCLALAAAVAVQAQRHQPPLVYTVEHTGAAFEAPRMPAPDALPVIRELPDALEGVKSFGDWAKRRSDI